MTDFLGIIPARYASSRFPGKPLAMLGAKPMIQWVYERASSFFDQVLVATDDKRIYKAVEGFGGLALMTSADHASGTERCAEAADLYEKQTASRFEYVVNIQGDEPLIQPEQLQILIDCMRSPGSNIATLIRPVENQEEVDNPNVVKVVINKASQALYFSRAPIPFVRNPGEVSIPTEERFYAHIGLYAFRREILQKVVKLPPSSLEQAESLEQLRWMEHGISIGTAITQIPSIGVDTPEDLEHIRKIINFDPDP